MTDILILGTGSVARAVANSMALLCEHDNVVTIASTSASRAHEVSAIAGLRASCADSPIRFQGVLTPDYNDNALYDLFLANEPKIVLLCSSLQSPWEKFSTPSAWTNLIQEVGFAISLPFQAAIAINAGKAIARLVNGPLLVNACFPDLVNPLLRSMRLPVFCDTGNVSLLEAAIRRASNCRS